MRLTDALGIDARALVAFVGAGGKKTAMGQLAAEGAREGLDVGYTTTTAMPPPPDLPLTLTVRDGYPYVISDRDPPLAFAREWVADPERAAEKVRGFDPEFLRSVYYSGVFDRLLVKADGARRREFKAPGEDEPVVPGAATHVVPVASVAAVGEPLTTDAVHRPERVAALTDFDVGDAITAEAVGEVLAHPDGGRRNVPSSASVVPLVNKADTTERRATARAVLDHALARTDRFSRGVVTSFETGVCEPVGTPAPEAGD
ncbi:selenium cofactor biosynthesis protein YqeC [Haloarcula salina]|uniref:Selenium-dependent hydroxylase accessory protein YqeC n=1 Tax=Haloarcula salina TaxID=1429914 RepID=A0AA41G9S1_9EURY|nr:selenium cofactor biosynthesis protein YqeC [Haloarcula salina]MBV0902767.1 putative selenium-dependent hydroxylase accessory protein YqeC [Haloarcula salina]